MRKNVGTRSLARGPFRLPLAASRASGAPELQGEILDHPGLHNGDESVSRHVDAPKDGKVHWRTVELEPS